MMLGLKATSILVSMMLCASPFILPTGDDTRPDPGQAPPITGQRCSFDDQGADLILENGLLHLTFDKTVNGGLDSVYDPAHGLEFRPDHDMPATLFRLIVRNATGDHVLSNTDVGAFSYLGTNSTDGSTLVLNYTDVGGTGVNVSAQVQVKDNDPRSYWNISVQNDNLSIAIVEVMYPIIWGLPFDIGGNNKDDALAVPKLDGMLYTEPYEKTQLPFTGNFRFLYPGTMSMQFMALYDLARSGIYFETRDPDGNMKEFFMENSGPQGNVMAGISHLGPEEYGSDLDVPYPSVLSFFEGSWYSAADMYKEWATTQPWTSKGRLPTRTDTPKWWLAPSPVVLIENYNIYGHQTVPVESWSDVVTRYNDRTGTNVTLFVRGWERNGTFTGPYYLPPKEGEAAIKDEVKEVIVAGGKVLFSMSERLWRLSIPGTGYDATQVFNTTGKPHAVLDTNGDPVMDPVSETLGIPGAVMDTSIPWWQDVVASNSRGIADLHVDGLLLEDVPTGAWTPCHNSSHGHPQGWGGYITEGHITTIEKAYNAGRAVNPDTFIATELPSELMIGQAQSYLSADNAPELSVHYLDDIHELGDHVRTEPMFTYVYHQYVPTFGTVVDIDAFSGPAMFNSSARSLARDLVRGKHVSVRVNGSGADDLKLIELFERTTEAMATYARDHAYLGEMLEPPFVPSPLLDITYFDPFHNDTGWTTVKDHQVLNSAWRAPDGQVGHTLVNWANDTVDISLELPNYFNSNDNFSVVITRNGEPLTLEASTTLPTTLTLTMNPRDVVLVEVMTAPDIVVEGIRASTLSPFKGQDVTLDVEVANRGSLDMPMVNIYLYEEGVFFDNVSIPVLGPDSNRTVQFTWPTTSKALGKHNLTARVWPRPEEISTTNNELTITLEVLPVPVGHIRCTVIDNSTRTPLAGAEVLLFHPSNGTIIDLKVTAPATDVTFEGLLPGTYGINVTKTDHLPAENTSIQVTADNTTMVTFSLVPEPVIEIHGDIEGFILDANTTVPISGAKVHLVELNMTFYTGIDGAFSFYGLEAGNYTLEVTRLEYNRAIITVQVVGGVVTYVNVNLEWVPPPLQRGDLVGVVLDKLTETTIAGATVVILGEDMTTISNDTGGFRIDSLLLGNYTLNVSASGYFSVEMNADVLIEGPNIVTVHLSPLEPPVPPTIQIKGFVKDKKERPVKAAIVKASWGAETRTTYSDMNGHYQFTGIEPGTILVTASALGYRNSTHELRLSQEGTYWVNFTIEQEKDDGDDEEEDPVVTYILVALNLLMLVAIIVMIVTGRKAVEKERPRKVVKKRKKVRDLDEDNDIKEEE